MNDHNIYNEDDLINALARRASNLVERIGDLRGSKLNPRVESVVGNGDPEVDALAEEYHKVSNELTRRRSRRESMRLSGFVAAIDGDEEVSDEMRAWWNNRY